MKRVWGFFVVGILAVSGLASAGVSNGSLAVRAPELTAQIWTQFDKGELSSLTVEFRQGDEIPMTLQAEGDLLETKAQLPTYVGVKRTFWVRMERNNVLLSLDGVKFRPFNQLIGGTLTVGASSDQNGGPASAINMLFKGHLK